MPGDGCECLESRARLAREDLVERPRVGIDEDHGREPSVSLSRLADRADEPVSRDGVTQRDGDSTVELPAVCPGRHPPGAERGALAEPPGDDAEGRARDPCATSDRAPRQWVTRCPVNEGDRG